MAHIQNNNLSGAEVFENSNGTFSILYLAGNTNYTISMEGGELAIVGTMSAITIGESPNYSAGASFSFSGFGFSGWGDGSSSGMGGFDGGGSGFGGGGLVDWNAINNWVSLRTSSPRNMLRFTFNTIETIGTTMEVIGLVGAPFSEGATLAYTQLGFYMNSVGVWGNAGIDIYDGQYWAAALSLARHYAFYGFGKLADKASGGLVDQLIMQSMLYSYDKIIVPIMGNNYIQNNPNSIFERIEYK